MHTGHAPAHPQAHTRDPERVAPTIPQVPVVERPPRRRLLLVLAAGASAMLLVLVALGAWKGGADFARRVSPIVATPPAVQNAAPVAVEPRPVRDVVAPTLVTFVAGKPRARRLPLPRLVSTTSAPAVSNASDVAAGVADVSGAPAGAVGAPAAVSAPSAATAPAASAPAGGASARAARDCEQPFFIDADGIKKFRRECM